MLKYFYKVPLRYNLFLRWQGWPETEKRLGQGADMVSMQAQF